MKIHRLSFSWKKVAWGFSKLTLWLVRKTGILNFMADHEIKNAVINVSLNSKIEDISKLKFLMNVKSFPNWGNQIMTARLNGWELISFFKGLVIIEKELGVVDSTTPAVRAYREIEKRNLDLDYSIADWAFQYSDNEYVPFGFIRNGAQTAYEYIQWREDLFNRIKHPQTDESHIKNLENRRLLNDYYRRPKLSNSEETLQKLALIEDEVDRKVDELLKDHPRELGFCHLFWHTKQELLKKEYGIHWLTPADCNPDIMFD